MSSMLQNPRPLYEQSQYYTPRKPSPLSSSPLRSSPLSPRDTNALPSLSKYHTMTSPSRTPPLKPLNRYSPHSGASSSISGSSSSRKSVYANRTTKANPLIHGKDVTDGRETRRNLFLKKVREDQEDKRWKARGGDDEIMRVIWIAEQRRRDERIKREALGLDEPLEEDEDMLNLGRSPTFGAIKLADWLDEVMADEVALQEEEELEAILKSLSQNHGGDCTIGWSQATNRSQADGCETHGQAGQGGADIISDTPYASDDEEYDQIFMDVIQQEIKAATQQEPDAYAEQDAMDMS